MSQVETNYSANELADQTLFYVEFWNPFNSKSSTERYITTYKIDGTLVKKLDYDEAKNRFVVSGYEDCYITDKGDSTTDFLVARVAKENYLYSLSYLSDLEFRTGSSSDNGSLYSAFSELYKYWDFELNRIYGLLRGELFSQEWEELRGEQRHWIRVRDRNAKDARSVYTDDADDSIDIYEMKSLVNDTKARTMELIDIYFEN